jgi:hypothetical protein
VVAECFYTTNTGTLIEFGWDGKETYYVSYNLGEKDNIYDRQIRVLSWNLVTGGSLLFPLNICPDFHHSLVAVRVLFWMPTGFQDYCNFRNQL